VAVVFLAVTDTGDNLIWARVLEKLNTSDKLVIAIKNISEK
jgi:hypothetical protein